MHNRRAAIADHEQLCELIERFYGIDNHEFDAARVDGGPAPLLCDDTHGQVWVAADSDELIGYAVVTWTWSLEPGGKDCVLDELYAERRGSGHGGSLLATRHRGGPQRRCRGDVPRNGGAQRRGRVFYRRHGFAVEDSTWMSLAL